MSEEQQEFGPGNPQAERMANYRDMYKGKKLKDLVILMQEAQIKKEKAEDLLKEINAEFDVLRFELVPGALEDAGVEKVTYEGIGRVSTTADLRLNLLKSDQPTFFKWLQKNKMQDLIQNTINSSTLKAWVKKRIKEGKEVPDVIKVTPITRASITKG